MSESLTLTKLQIEFLANAEPAKDEPIGAELEKKLKTLIYQLTEHEIILKWPIPLLCDACGIFPPHATLTNPATHRKPIFLCNKCERHIEGLAREMAQRSSAR